jgi:hypothetical protein
MTAALEVCSSDAARRAGDIDAVVASLPVSLRFGATGTDLVAVDGQTGWPAAALQAIEGGAKGLVIIDPTAEDVADLVSLARRRGVPVVIDYPFAGNPAVPVVAPYFNDGDDRYALLECTVTARLGADLVRVLIDQLALVGALAVQVGNAKVLDWTTRRYVISGLLADGRRARLTGICTDVGPPTATVRMLRADGSVELTVPNPETARPAHATVVTPDGAKSLPTLFETAHRLAWRRLARLVHDGGQASDLANFTHDSSTVAVLTGALPSR